jgi:hypothetical protein
VTIDGFIQKWRRRKDDVFLADVSLGVSKCDAPARSNLVIEATASVWVNHRGVEVSQSARIVLRAKQMDACRREALRKLDQQLTEQVDWVLRLDTGNPRLSKPVLVVLAGAGFSRGLGLPITSELKRITRRRCVHPDPRSDIHRVEIDKYPLSEFGTRNGRIPDIEYLLTIWSGYLSQMQQTGFNLPSEPARYRLFLENVSCHLHKRSASTAHSRRLAALGKWLRDAITKYDVRFLTFNYDTILELMCGKAGLRFTYLDRAADGSVIPIRKLHGSLNWRTFDWQRDFSADPDACELYRDGERRVYAFNDVTQFSTQGSADPPLIIPPSAAKNTTPCCAKYGASRKATSRSPRRY